MWRERRKQEHIWYLFKMKYSVPGDGAMLLYPYSPLPSFPSFLRFSSLLLLTNPPGVETRAGEIIHGLLKRPVGS